MRIVIQKNKRSFTIMLFLLLAEIQAVKEKDYFIGNWNYTSFYKNDHSHVGNVLFSLVYHHYKKGIHGVTCNLTYINTTYLHFSPGVFHAYGITNKKHTPIALIYGKTQLFPEKRKYFEFIQNITEFNPNTNVVFDKSFHDSVVKVVNQTENRTYTIVLHAGFNNTFADRYQKKNSTFNGTMHTHTGYFRITARNYDYYLYSKECKVLCIIIAMFLCSLVVAENTVSVTRYDIISPIGSILNSAFDMNFALCFSDQLFDPLGIKNLYSFLAFSSIFVYFRYRLKYPIMSWIQNTENIYTMNDNGLRFSDTLRSFLRFFFMFMLSNIIYINFFHSFNAYPFLFTFFLFGVWIPQITHSAMHGYRKTLPNQYIIILSVARLISFSYLMLFDTILNIKNQNAFVFAVILTIIQVIILILQNKFGGAFFIPSKYRAVQYDYYASRPEQGTECSICMCIIEETDLAVTTPCSHSFHDECLRRWMNERPICPICRHELPPLSEEEDI